MPTSHDLVPVVRLPWRTRPLWLIGLSCGLAAAAVSILIYLLARAAGVPMALTEVFADHFARMPIMNMAWAALLDGALVGTVLAAACRRWTKRPRSAFVAVTTVGLIASFALPVISDASVSTKIVLSISHIAVATIIVPALALALPSRTPHDRGMRGRSSRH